MATIVGKVIGGYEIQEEVGRGAMGVVFKAQHIAMQRTVALKFLPKRMAQDQKRVQRFIREAHAAGQLNHPNIVQVHDVGQMDGLYFISMEFVDGTTADKRVKQEGRLPEKEVIEIGLQVAAALKEAHNRGILHRDVKPDNFLIDKAGHVRLADLGLARFEKKSGEEGHLTQDGTALGTPHYMAPEQAKGSEVDARSDLYGLGASMFAMASGTTPFEGATAAMIMVSVINDPPRSLKKLVPELSPGFVAVIEKQLEKDPKKRFQTAQEFVEALEKVKAGEYGHSGATTGRVGHVTGRGAGRVTTKAAGRVGPRPRSTEPSAQGKTDATLYVGVGIGAVVILGGLFLFAGSGSNSGQTARPNRTSAAARHELPRTVAQEPVPIAKVQSPKTDRKAAWAKAFESLAGRHEEALQKDPAGQAAAWEAFVKAYPQSEQADEAKRKGAEARRAGRVLQTRWEEARDNSMGAVSSGDLMGAVQALEAFVGRHAESPQALEAKGRLQELREKAIVQIREKIGKSVSMAESGEAAEARAMLAALQERAPSLAKQAGLDGAIEKIDALVRASKQKDAQQAEADRQGLQKAHQEAAKLVTGAEQRFQFGRAAQAYQAAANGMRTKKGRVAAALWAERYLRAAKLWQAAEKAIKGGRKVEVSALGTYRDPGRVVGWTAGGLLFKGKLPAAQTVTWKSLTGEHAATVVRKLHEGETAPAQALDQGLLAYAVTAFEDAVDLLDKARRKDAALQALADEPYELAKGALQARREEKALQVLAAAKAAFQKKDQDAVKREIGPLVEGGQLADTKAAQAHKAEIGEWAKFAAAAPAQPEPVAEQPPVAQADVSKQVKVLGWTRVEGTWTQSPDNKAKGHFRAKDGKLSVSILDAAVQVVVNVKPDTKLSLLVRKVDLAAADGMVGGGQPGGALQWAQQRLGKEVAAGYGVKIENGTAKFFMPNGGNQGPRPRRRGRRAFGEWGRHMAEAAVLSGEPMALAPGVYKITVTATDRSLDLAIQGTTGAGSRGEKTAGNVRLDGVVELKIEGVADVSMPWVKKSR